MPRQPTLPPGSYYDAELEGYVLPHEDEWDAAKFASAAEETFPVCSGCGDTIVLLIFTTVRPLTDEARAMGDAERPSNITGLCLDCAEKVKAAQQAAEAAREGGAPGGALDS